MDDSNPVGIVYAGLVHAFAAAHGGKETRVTSAEIDAAIRVLEALWPDECRRWDEMVDKIIAERRV